MGLHHWSREDLIRSRESAWFVIPERERLIKDLGHLVTDPPRHREKSLRLVGPANTGKSRIIRRFMQEHPCTQEEELDTHPIVLLRMSGIKNTSQFIDELLLQVTPVIIKGNEQERTRYLTQLLRTAKTQVIVLDEFHDVISVGKQTARHMLTKIKDLNNAGFRMVPVGTTRMSEALALNPELSSRFVEKEVGMLSFQDCTGIAVAFLERVGWGEASHEYSRSAHEVHRRTGGVVGNVLDVLEEGILRAQEQNASLTPSLMATVMQEVGL